ncbi:MAG: hypothetical protein LBS99_03770, partial [Clostridiales bacterium]|jgi:hypothetical protein|nr:hypothetical protein [Clostridiales bacterium]
VNFKRIYDEFTKYVKDKAIAGEFVDFNNFKAQLRKKAYFAKYGTARFKSDAYGQNDGEPEGCYILDILKLCAACGRGEYIVTVAVVAAAFARAESGDAVRRGGLNLQNDTRRIIGRGNGKSA